MKFEIRRNKEQIAELNDLKDRLNEDLNVLTKKIDLRFSDSAMKELSSLKSEMSSLAIEEANISDKMSGLKDANEMLLSKVKMLESENDGMKQAIDLMRIEVQDMNTNEQLLVNRLKEIDFQNNQLLKESDDLGGESATKKKLGSLKYN